MGPAMTRVIIRSFSSKARVNMKTFHKIMMAQKCLHLPETEYLHVMEKL